MTDGSLINTSFRQIISETTELEAQLKIALEREQVMVLMGLRRGNIRKFRELIVYEGYLCSKSNV